MKVRCVVFAEKVSRSCTRVGGLLAVEIEVVVGVAELLYASSQQITTQDDKRRRSR